MDETEISNEEEFNESSNDKDTFRRKTLSFEDPKLKACICGLSKQYVSMLVKYTGCAFDDESTLLAAYNNTWYRILNKRKSLYRCANLFDIGGAEDYLKNGNIFSASLDALDAALKEAANVAKKAKKEGRPVTKIDITRFSERGIWLGNIALRKYKQGIRSLLGNDAESGTEWTPIKLESELQAAENMDDEDSAFTTIDEFYLAAMTSGKTADTPFTVSNFGSTHTDWIKGADNTTETQHPNAPHLENYHSCDQLTIFHERLLENWLQIKGPTKNLKKRVIQYIEDIEDYYLKEGPEYIGKVLPEKLSKKRNFDDTDDELIESEEKVEGDECNDDEEESADSQAHEQEENVACRTLIQFLTSEEKGWKKNQITYINQELKKYIPGLLRSMGVEEETVRLYESNANWDRATQSIKVTDHRNSAFESKSGAMTSALKWLKKHHMETIYLPINLAAYPPRYQKEQALIIACKELRKSESIIQHISNELTEIRNAVNDHKSVKCGELCQTFLQTFFWEKLSDKKKTEGKNSSGAVGNTELLDFAWNTLSNRLFSVGGEIKPPASARKKPFSRWLLTFYPEKYDHIDGLQQQPSEFVCDTFNYLFPGGFKDILPLYQAIVNYDEILCNNLLSPEYDQQLPTKKILDTLQKLVFLNDAAAPLNVWQELSSRIYHLRQSMGKPLAIAESDLEHKEYHHE